MKDEVTLPVEIELRDQWPESARFVLPGRKLGRGRWLGLVLLVIGAMLMALVVSTLLSAALGLPRQRFGTWLIPVLFLASFTWGGLTPFWWGLVILAGHRELEIRGGYLRTIERVGPLWRSKRWRIEQIASIEVKPISSQETSTQSEPLDAFTALVLHTTTGKQGMLAWGYSKTLLVELAPVLAARCEAALEQQSLATGGGSSAHSIAVYGTKSNPSPTTEGEVDDDELDDEATDRAGEDLAADDPAITSPPFGSTIVFEQHGGGDLTVRVPPAGLIKGSQGLFAFSIIWCGILALIDGFAIVGAWQQGKLGNIGVLIGFSGLFWAIGIATMLAAINMGRREAAIALVGDTLMALQKGLFGSQRREWQFDDIAQIKMAPSGLEVNKQKVMQLEIHDTSGDIFRLLAGRTNAELKWLAAILRQSLRSARSGEASSSESPPT